MMKKLTLLFSLLTMASASFAQDGHAKLPSEASAPVVTIVEGRLGAIIGGVQNGKIISAKEAEKSLVAATNFRLYGPEGVNEGELTIKTEGGDEDICPEFYGVTFSEKVSGGIAFTDNVSWDPMPRAPRRISGKNKTYRKIVSDFLKSKGIAKPKTKISEAFRVDLDGNGTDEVIIRGTNYSNFGPGAKKGEYSFVLVRQIVAGNKVKNVLLTGDFFPKAIQFGAPNKHQISGIADLDGDGKMEVVIFGAYYEGEWIEAYSLEKGVKKLKFQTGCGV